MNRSFVTFLGTDDFLPGVLALHQSLKTYNFRHDLLVLVTNNVYQDVIKFDSDFTENTVKTRVDDLNIPMYFYQ